MSSELRRRRRRRLPWAIALAALVVVAGTYLPLTLLAPLSPVAAATQQQAPLTQPVAALSWPVTGVSAIGAIGFPGILASSGDSAPHPIASITKIITSLVVLKAKPLQPGQPGPSITVTAKAAGLYGKYLAQNGTVKPMAAGSVMSQFEMNEIMLISSANNYAEAYGTWAFGSEKAFLDAARDWLAANGLTHTTLLDSSGMNPGNTSTTTDLVALGKLALANPVIAGIVSTKSLSLPSVGELRNTNKLLGFDGVDGIKTGTLDEAGACLLFSAEYRVGSHTVTIVGVVLGAVDHDGLEASVKSLLPTIRAGFHDVTLAKAGESFANYSTPWNTAAKAVAATSASVLVWGDTPITRKVSPRKMLGAGAGSVVGSVTFTVVGQRIVVPLKLDRGLGEPDAWWRLTNPTALLAG
jgi:D-alanyl-D-alanine carboxypeptidase (penicillin-binding protein 5/6)